MSKRKSYFFEFLNQIMFIKDKSFFTEETKRDYSIFMVNRYLSMNKKLTATINYIQCNTAVTNPQDHFNMMIDVIPFIPKHDRYNKYIKKTNSASKYLNEDEIRQLADYFECRDNEVDDMCDTMGKKWLKDIVKMLNYEGIKK